MQTATWSAKQSIKEHEISSPDQKARDFRAVFYELDPAVLITADEFAALMCITRTAFDFRLHIGKVPDPVIRENRCVRWRVSDVRAFLENMQQVPADPARVLGGRAQRILAREAAGVPRRGRPRHVAADQ
jgi:predicted DNA-binding transcriptional regulator AlpA